MCVFKQFRWKNPFKRFESRIRFKGFGSKDSVQRFASVNRKFVESRKNDSATPKQNKILANTQSSLLLKKTSRNLELSYQIHRCWFELNSRNQCSVHWRLAIINRHAESNTVPAWHKKPDQNPKKIFHKTFMV